MTQNSMAQLGVVNTDTTPRKPVTDIQAASPLLAQESYIQAPEEPPPDPNVRIFQLSLTGNGLMHPATFNIGDGVNVPATGTGNRTWPCPIVGQIAGWYLTAQPSGSCVLDIWKANNAIPTVANSIINTGAGGVKPSLSSATIASAQDPDNWTTDVETGDIFMVNLDSVTNCTAITLVLEILRT